jgi:hypothetical protein
MEMWIRKGLVTPLFMHAFKALVERRLFHLVIVGQSEIDRVIRDDPNVFGVFSIEPVTYLEPAHARQLIEVPIQSGSTSRFRLRAVDLIVELTGGNPFYIQRFCSELVEYMNDQRAPEVTEADVDRVREQFLDRLEERDFDNLESHGRDSIDRADYQAVLLAVARASEEGPATLERIFDGGDDPQHAVLKELVLHDVVRREAGTYRIVVGIYRDWLLRYFGSQPKVRAS